MLKKIGISLLAFLFSVPVFAATVPLIPSSPQYSEPSQIIGTFNYMIGTLQNNIGGATGAVPGPVVTTGTSIQVLGTVTAPAGLLATTGQALRVKCWGAGTATGTNTMTVQVGTATAFAVAGGATTAGVFAAEVWVQKTGASTQSILSAGSFNVTPTTPTIIAATQTDTAAIPITCSGTSTTTGNFTLNGMTVEQIK